MINKFLKIAGVTNEADFYKKYPTEEAFMKAHSKEIKDELSNLKTGGIPERYRNMGFTHVGQKKAGDGKHKWKVLAKKGDKYKVVQGGWKGMQDYKQHHDPERRKRFWQRMGGKNSPKAKDPFSPLYWHKRFGTWQEGGDVNQQEQIMHLLEIYSEINNINPEALIKELEKAPDSEKQKMLQEIMQDVQEYMQEHKGHNMQEEQHEPMQNQEEEHSEMMRDGGYIKEVGGVPLNQANAELEKGEVFQNRQGEIQKVAESEPTHENGGSYQNNVSRVLEDTADKRLDRDSKLLKVTPDQAEKIVGFKPKSAMSHSKLYEAALEHYDKKLKSTEKKIDKNLDYVKYGGGKYAENSLTENIKFMQMIPTKAELFDNIYNNQESVKRRYKIGEENNNKYGGLPKYQTGDPITEEVKTKAKRLSKKEDIPSTAKELGKFGSDTYYINSTTGDTYVTKAPTTGKYAPQDPTTFIPKLVDYKWEDLTKKDASGKSIIKDTPANKAIYDQARLAKYPTTTNDYFVYGQQEPGIPVTTEMPSVGSTNQTYNFGKGVQASKFNEPLRWYDVAGNIMNYLSSLEAEPVPLEQLQREKLRVHELNPLPAVQQTIADYNTAMQMMPTSGVGFANVANLAAKKYDVTNKILGEYENINKGKYDTIDQLNAAAKYETDVANLGLRDTFNQRVARRNEIQRQSKLNALDDLFTKIALNRKLNREGNLVLELTPYFDQYGRFNGNKYNMQITGSRANIIDKNTNRVVKSVNTDVLDENGNLKKTTVTQTSTP